MAKFKAKDFLERERERIELENIAKAIENQEDFTYNEYLMAEAEIYHSDAGCRD